MVFKYLEDIKYRKDQSIRKVMEGFSKTAIHTDSSGFGVIVDDNDQCIGIITDGMIRRVLSKGLSIDMPIKDIMNKNPILINQGYTLDEVMTKFSNSIRQLPVVNGRNCMVDLLLFSEFKIPI